MNSLRGVNDHTELIQKTGSLRSIMQRSFSEYNQDDYAINCANGVIDLKTGEIQEHKPEFFTHLTKS